MARRNVELLIIDPQNDFCSPSKDFAAIVSSLTGKESQEALAALFVPPGSLFVGGADKDMSRLAGFIGRNIFRIGDIHVTLDSHHILDVAHPMFWKDPAGAHPNPFTLISMDDVANGKWRPYAPKMKDPVYGTLQERMEHYVGELAANGRYMLCIWPPHCLIGTIGTAVVPELMAVLQQWEVERDGFVDYVTKGSNIYTEHYSGVQADVPDQRDPGTLLNTGLIETLERADEILIAGEALSHCVKFTVTDIADALSPEAVKKFVLLTDASSSVTGFEADGENFVKDLTARGMRVATTENYQF